MANSGVNVALADTDFLVQVFLTRQRLLLAKFSAIQPIVVVEEVESEIRWHRKFRSQFEPEFERARRDHEVAVLDKSNFIRLTRDHFGEALAAEQFDAFQATGAQYAKQVGIGEAYTHAAAVRLVAPVFSHDRKDAQFLRALGLPVGSPILTYCDLLRLGVDEAWITAAHATENIKFLKNQNEWVPEPLRHGATITEIVKRIRSTTALPRNGRLGFDFSD